MEDNVLVVNIAKKPSFVETWYEGSVEYEGKEHKFWLIDPVGDNYECEVRWFFKSVPREVRVNYATILELFKKEKYGAGTD